MNPHDLTDPIISKMSPEARRKLGVQTAEEAMAAFIVNSEKELHRGIKSLLSLRGIKWHCHSRTDRPTTQKKGVPDFLFVANRLPIAWEAKYLKNRLSPEQEAARDAMIQDGWKWSLITSLDQAISILNEVQTTYIG